MGRLMENGKQNIMEHETEGKVKAYYLGIGLDWTWTTFYVYISTF